MYNTVPTKLLTVSTNLNAQTLKICKKIAKIIQIGYLYAQR